MEITELVVVCLAEKAQYRREVEARRIGDERLHDERKDVAHFSGNAPRTVKKTQYERKLSFVLKSRITLEKKYQPIISITSFHLHVKNIFQNTRTIRG